ncbi:MAG: hypothetical protein ACRDFQ_07400 [Anaerolineales bacterium]
MIGQIGYWIELSFWQLVVRLLNEARPLSSKISKARSLIAVQPTPRFLRDTRLIALSGWAIGLALGFTLAIFL